MWELEINVSIGKRERSASDAVNAALSCGDESRITAPHAAMAGQLPKYRRDLFDRMIIARGPEEGLTVVTPDEAFALYDVDVLEC